jgi:hypothetical protein
MPRDRQVIPRFRVAATRKGRHKRARDLQFRQTMRRHNHSLKHRCGQLESKLKRRGHVQNHTMYATPNPIISKKLMKVHTEFRVQYQCMPRSACADFRCVRAWYPVACFVWRVPFELRRRFHA